MKAHRGVELARAGRALRGAVPALAATLLTIPLLGGANGIRAAAATTAVTANPVLAWGSNFEGEAGNGGFGDQLGYSGGYAYNDYPVAAGPLANAIAVSAGLFSSAAIVQGHAADGTPDPTQNTVWTWGDDEGPQLGARPPDICDEPGGVAGYHDPCAKRPVQVRGSGGAGYLTGIVAIAEGGSHVLALRYDGTVWAWGDNTAGELGRAPSNGEAYPVQVPGLTGVTAVAANVGYSLAIVHHGVAGPDDTLWAWGDNSVGELGQGWDCGGGSIGPGLRCGAATPAPVPGMSGVSAIAAGDLGQIMAIVRGAASDGSNNQLWTWGGDNAFLESGNSQSGQPIDPATGHPSYIDRPQRVLDASGTGYFAGAVAVSTGYYATVALRYEPALHTTTVWNWGSAEPASSGTPGAGGAVWPTPRQVRGPDGDGFLTGGVAVASTYVSSHVLLTDGTVWGWGDNRDGNLAVAQADAPAGGWVFPVRARGVAEATAIAGGWDHVLALGPLPPPPPPVVPNPTSDTPPPLPFEQPATSPGQPLQTTASVPVVSTVVTPSTVNSPPPPTGVATQPVSTPVQVVTPAHAPSSLLAQGSQPVVGAGPVSGSTGALAPNAGDRPTPTDQLAMLRHEDAADVVWAAALGAGAAAAFAICVVATARTRRPPTVRPAPAWAATAVAGPDPPPRQRDRDIAGVDGVRLTRCR